MISRNTDTRPTREYMNKAKPMTERGRYRVQERRRRKKGDQAGVRGETEPREQSATEAKSEHGLQSFAFGFARWHRRWDLWTVHMSLALR